MLSLRSGAAWVARKALRLASKVPLSSSVTASDKAPYYITTPIYYVNDKPHIGHAYTTLACDVLARWMRSEGRPVTFVTGTDEHGQKVQEAAKKAGLPPQQYVDQLSATFRELSEVRPQK